MRERRSETNRLFYITVAGEIGQTPSEEFQGQKYEGKGFGTRFLVNHGVIADYALVAEGTDFKVTRGEAGDVWFKITIHGKGGIYMPFLQRPYKFEDNPNAIVKTAPVISAIEEWAYEYQEKNKFEFEDGVIVPKVNIGAIRGGLGVRPSQTPGICRLYMDVRLTPSADVSKIKSELGSVVGKCNVNYSIESYLYRRGYVGTRVEPLIESIYKAHRLVLNEDPLSKREKIASPLTSMWRDLNVFNESGIPAVTYGPNSYTYKSLTGEELPFLTGEDLEKISKIYLFTALDLCNKV
jgi:acetylornithine deacetylase/succinyl-diaminopimelate desuccinylase-like protein